VEYECTPDLRTFRGDEREPQVALVDRRRLEFGRHFIPEIVVGRVSLEFRHRDE
jgi:hypothetical protein